MTAAFQANARDRQSMPLVTAAESAEDQQFFFENLERRYRIGTRWVVRRRGAEVFLRAPILAGPPADDSEPAAERDGGSVHGRTSHPASATPWPRAPDAIEASSKKRKRNDSAAL